MIADYFTEDELIKKTGISKNLWDFVILKELIDNALDAIEALSEKKVFVNFEPNHSGLQIFDNGTGISINTVNQIYDFSVYISKNRHFITPSRGKQGNGLKTIISICYLMGYKLLWHTSDGVIIENVIDASDIDNGFLQYKTKDHGATEYRGVEIVGYSNTTNKSSINIIKRYSMCNKDVNFYFQYGTLEQEFPATIPCIDKSSTRSISFYDYHSFKRLICDTQDGNSTYKAFLGEMFGTRIKNQSNIKCRIKDIDFSNLEFQKDFLELRSFQKSKQYTLLKNHMIGLKYSMNTEVMLQKSSDEIDTNISVPCIVEFDVEKIDLKSEKGYLANCDCLVNNTITYNMAKSIVFDSGFYELGNKKCTYSYDLGDLLEKYNDYSFTFHFISPYFLFRDAGKTEIDITCFLSAFLKELTKILNKEKRIYDAKIEKPLDTRTLMRNHLDEAFEMASTNGKYAITARQIWYKIRELSGITETPSTYSDFTQNILTTWLNDHPEYESKVNFSDRGNFYVGEMQRGLGTANVRTFIDGLNCKNNTFQCYGGINSDVYVKEEFNIEYQYDKVLYIEKTGFDAIFKAEKIGEKYNMVIVSGQGFSTRAAKTLLYALQQKGMRLFCVHDLDISGVHICETLKTPNDKFQHPIKIEDLGITIDDVNYYDIKPEEVEKTKDNRNKLISLSSVYKNFFDGGRYYKRVELNAFSTEQILEILERKLSEINNLPKINLKDTLEIDHSALREVAFLRLIENKYKDELSEIYIPCDLSDYEGKYTVDMAKKEIPEIKEKLILQYEREIEKKLNILRSPT